MVLRAQVKCPGGTQCTYDHAICNGGKDCLDGSDENEAFCSAYDCSAKYQVCSVGAVYFAGLRQ